MEIRQRKLVINEFWVLCDGKKIRDADPIYTEAFKELGITGNIVEWVNSDIYDRLTCDDPEIRDLTLFQQIKMYAHKYKKNE